MGTVNTVAEDATKKNEQRCHKMTIKKEVIDAY